MPNAKVLESKKAVVTALEEQLKNASAGVLVDYTGITVAEDTKLRAVARQNGIQYGVVKNTLVRRALEDAKLDELDGVLNGNTSLATGSDDPITPIRIISDYAKGMGADSKFHIKAAFLEGKVLSADEIEKLSKLSSKKDLQAQVMGTLLAPISQLAAVIAAIAESKGGSAEEAPAAE